MGKEDIQQLLGAAIKKFEKETGEVTKLNQNPDNYKGLAKKLTEISNSLPKLYPNEFEQDNGGKYDITTYQIRDAYQGKVDSIKRHFNEALHLYLDGERKQEAKPKKKPHFKIRHASLLIVSSISFITALFFLYKWLSLKDEFENIKSDMRITPYTPRKAEIDRVEGVYLVYTGSPQVRKSDANRYHMVVPSIVKIDCNKRGYFKFYRYGPIINQDGYMQFEDSNIISFRSNYIDPETGKKTVPKQAQMQLEKGKDTFNVISASWSFDPDSNVMIGIREVFIKLGKGGKIENVTHTFNKPSGKKDLRWIREDGKTDTIISLQNVRLETLPKTLQQLLDENSIILKEPDDNAFAKRPVKEGASTMKSN